MQSSLNKRSFQLDMGLLRDVWRLALPVMLTNLLQTLVEVVDVFMVGRLGPIAIAAVGMSFTIRLLVLVMVLSVSAGAMSLVAQAKGARDPQRMSFVTRQAISSGVLLSLLLTVLGLLTARPILSWVNSGGDPLAVEIGTEYLQVLFVGTVFLILNIVFNRLMQGAGDTVTPLILTGALNFLNILLNYLFMFGFGPVPAYGVTGAAIGTVISRGLGVVVVLYLFYSGKNVIKILPGTYWPHWQTFWDILTIGVPSGIQGVLRNGSRLLVIGIVTSTEVATYGAAALGIAMQIEALAFMPVLGINVAATSLVGQALGAWQTDEARRRGNMAIGLGVVVMIVLATPIWIFAPAILRLFDPSAHPIVMSAGTEYMRINVLVLPLVGIAMVANGALRGAGDSTPGMYSTFLTKGVVTVTLAYLFAIVLGYGSTGVWYALVIGSVLDAIYMGTRWRGSTWLSVALHKTEIYRRHLHKLSEMAQQRFLSDVRTPNMARPTATEEIGESGVVYRLEGGDVQVVFAGGGYEVNP
ncbi:MAG: MATE family efflux transporter [Chloroflexota bacterium]